MKIFTCIDHDVVSPTGVASIVVAENTWLAESCLSEELIKHGLKGSGFTLQEIDIETARAIILCDGDY